MLVYLTANDHGAPLLKVYGIDFKEPKHPTEPDDHAFVYREGTGVFSTNSFAAICTEPVPDQAALAAFDRLVGPEVAAIRAATAGMLTESYDEVERCAIRGVDFILSESYMEEIRERIRVFAAEKEHSFKWVVDDA